MKFENLLIKLPNTYQSMASQCEGFGEHQEGKPLSVRGGLNGDGTVEILRVAHGGAVGDAANGPSHPLESPSHPALILSQHQCLF